MAAALLLALAVSLSVSTPARANDTASDELQLLEYTNQQRAAAGVPALKLWLPAVQVARTHSAEMAATGVFQHSPDWNFVPSIWSSAAQNIGFTTPPLSGDEAIQRIQCGERGCEPLPSPVPPCPLPPFNGSPSDRSTSFLTSQAHCTSLMSATYNYVGIGVAYGADGRMWVTVDFFNIADPNLGFPKSTPASESPAVGGPSDGDLPNNTWYFAEGYTGPLFETYLTILNTNSTTASATITYFLQGSTKTKNVSVPAKSRVTVDTRTEAGDNQDVGAKVTSDIPVVAERSMTFKYGGSIDGGSALVGKTSLATNFFLAEGYTGPGFAEWLTVINPGATPAPLKVTYMKPDGSTVVKTNYTVPAGRRLTINVNADIPASDVSAYVQSTSEVPILVERPMYFSYHSPTTGATYTGGHVGAGIDQLGTSFRFAEGYTGTGFDEWITVQNPDPSESGKVTFRYLLDSGPPVEETFTIGPASRFTRLVNNAVPGRSLSTDVRSDVPIAVERPMYFSYSGWTDGHNAPGIAETHHHWYVPDLDTRAFSETWLTLSNSNGSAATVTFRFYDEAGNATTRNGTVAANSRGTFKVNTLAGDGRRLGVIVSSNQKIAVEKPHYFWLGSVDGGTDAIGYGLD